MGGFCPTVDGSSIWIFDMATILSSSLLGHTLHYYIIQLHSYLENYWAIIPLV